MEIRKITEKTFYIKTKMACVPFYKAQNGQIVLLDAGDESERDEFVGLLDGEGYRVGGIIASHAHPDHLGAVAAYQERGAVVAMPSFEAACVSSAETLKAWYPLFTIGEIKRLFSGILFESDHLIGNHDQTVSLCGETFRIIHTPGHTPQHICIVTPDEVLYLADALMSAKECARAKLPYAFSINLDFQTKQVLRNTGTQSSILAHGGLVEDLNALIDINADIFNRKLEQMTLLFDQPMTMDQIVSRAIETLELRSRSEVYRFRILERNIRVYVEYLVDSGILENIVDGGMNYYQKRG